MSEFEIIINQFVSAKHSERAKSGQNPVVCVAGWLNHAELCGALAAKYEGIPMKPVEASESTAPLEWDGVKIYPSRSFERGFYFGHREMP